MGTILAIVIVLALGPTIVVAMAKFIKWAMKRVAKTYDTIASLVDKEE